MSYSILVFHLGELCDTLVALPAFSAVRRHFPEAKLTLLSDRHQGKSPIVSGDLLEGPGLFDAFESYPVEHSIAERCLRPWRMLSLSRQLRAGAFDTLVYLMPSARTPAQVRRDRKFFAAAGIKNFIGMDGFPDFPPRKLPLPVLPHETDALLARLAVSGIQVPPAGQAQMNLGLTGAEEAEVRRWLKDLPSDGNRPWIGIGLGSTLPANRWPLERFEEVVTYLIQQFSVWPVIFGGPDDKPAGEAMLKTWRRGYNAAGSLGLKASARALAQCAFYLGNDTGHMHLAAAVGVRCVALFSARDWPGRWYPYGLGHKIFREPVDCEGCGFQTCTDHKCLGQIQSAQVKTASAEVFRLALSKAA